MSIHVEPCPVLSLSLFRHYSLFYHLYQHRTAEGHMSEQLAEVQQKHCTRDKREEIKIYFIKLSEEVS